MRVQLALVVILIGVVASVAAAPPDAAPQPAAPLCVLETSMGSMSFRLFQEQAPQTVANFTRLVAEGFYDGLPFYRVVAGHVIQAGDGGENEQPTVPGEFGAHPHVKGALGLARGEDPSSGSTEIYICHAARPHLDGRYAVFGLIEKGETVLDAIASVEVKEQWVGEDKDIAFHEPLMAVTIERAFCTTGATAPAAGPAPEADAEPADDSGTEAGPATEAPFDPTSDDGDD